jgi:hypothetical protein
MGDTKDTKKKIEATEPQKDTASILLPYAPGEDSVVFVGLNGKGYTINRGERAEVPKAVADILEEAEARRQAKLNRIAELKRTGTGVTGH